MLEADYLQKSDEILQNLREIPVLKSFDEKDLRGLSRMSTIKRYEPGEFIIDERFQDNWIYFLISGLVRITKGGKEIRVLRRRGDIFGEMSAIDGSTRSASAYAIDETVCVATNASRIDKLLGNEKFAFYSVLYQSFAETLAERLRSTTKELVEASGKIEQLQFELDQLKGDR
jgi:CRP-like cAMP-binding protein